MPHSKGLQKNFDGIAVSAVGTKNFLRVASLSIRTNVQFQYMAKRANSVK